MALAPAPNSIDNQDGRRIGDWMGALRFSRRLGGLSREYVPEEQIRGLLEIAQGQPQWVQIQGLVQHQRHRQLVASQHLPRTIRIAATQLRLMPVGDEAVAGPHAAGVRARAMERDAGMRLALQRLGRLQTASHRDG
jgi:hypothetical protein